METAALVLFGYLLGSIPSAYVAARLLRGIDLRLYGSGTVSGTGVFQHVARWAIVPVGICDLAKAAFPTWLALHLGLGLWPAALAGLAAAVGHNWPLYLAFRGGRGLSTFMGILVVLFPWGFPWLILGMLAGRLLGGTAVGALLAVALLPVLTSAVGRPAPVVAACIGMLIITILKRLEANRLPLPADPAARRQVLLYRLLQDRDVSSREAWVQRRPAG